MAYYTKTHLKINNISDKKMKIDCLILHSF